MRNWTLVLLTTHLMARRHLRDWTELAERLDEGLLGDESPPKVAALLRIACGTATAVLKPVAEGTREALIEWDVEVEDD